jgi:hypothetical protein
MRAIVAASVLLSVGSVGACGNDGGPRVKRDRDAAVSRQRPDGSGISSTPVDEKEPNDQRDQATALPPGHLIRATLDGEKDVDLYKVTVDRGGRPQLRVSLTGIEGVDLVLELRDGSGELLAKSDHGPAQVGEGLPGFGVTKGDYYLSVSEFVKKKPKPKAKPKGKPKKGAPPDAGPQPAGSQTDGRVGPSAPYQLSVELVDQPEALTEAEPDDDQGAAVEVLLADRVHGWIGWDHDIDVWKLPLDAVGDGYAIDLDVTGVDGLVLTVAMLDAGGDKLLTRKSGKGGPVEIRGLVPLIGSGDAPVHYVTIAADRSNPDASYELHFTARPREDDEETEPDDDAAHASPLTGASSSTGGGAVRATYAAGDIDHFAIAPPGEPSLLDVTIEPPAGVDLDLEVGVPGQPPLATAHAAGAGGKERISGLVLAADARTVIKVSVHGKGAKDDGGDARPYRLVWSIAPAGADPMPPEEPVETDAAP